VNFLSLIEQKREGKILAPEEIQNFIREFTVGNSRIKAIAESVFGIILKS
jgi:thymidine phosphorylase